MDAYERINEAIRRGGAYHNPPVPEIGIMTTDGKIKLDSITLEKDDYLMDCNLRFAGDKNYIHTSKTSSGEYLSDSEHNATLQEYTANILQEGDQVLVMKLKNEEKFILIGKVVRPS